MRHKIAGKFIPVYVRLVILRYDLQVREDTAALPEIWPSILRP